MNTKYRREKSYDFLLWILEWINSHRVKKTNRFVRNKTLYSVTGSMGVVHVSCLEEWLRGSTRDSCELCSGTFKIIRTPKYSCCQSLWIFFSNKVSILRLVRDLIFLSVSVTNTFILIYLWLTFIIKDIVNVFGEQIAFLFDFIANIF